MSNEATPEKATTETAPPSCAPSNCSGATVFITHIFSRTIIIESNGCRIWLNRDEAIQLLEMLPGAINKMAVKI